MRDRRFALCGPDSVAQKDPTEEAEDEAEESDEGRSLRLLSGGVQSDAVYGALVALGARTSADPAPAHAAPPPSLGGCARGELKQTGARGAGVVLVALAAIVARRRRVRCRPPPFPRLFGRAAPAALRSEVRMGLFGWASGLAVCRGAAPGQLAMRRCLVRRTKGLMSTEVHSSHKPQSEARSTPRSATHGWAGPEFEAVQSA
jgi:hypothetical protein